MKASPEVHRTRSAYAYAIRMGLDNVSEKRLDWLAARLRQAAQEARAHGMSQSRVLKTVEE